MLAFRPAAHVVGLPGTHDVGQRNRVGLAGRLPEDRRRATEFGFDGPLLGREFVRAGPEFLLAG